MDRQLLERMIGAGILIVALVLIVPAILDGQRADDPDADSVIDSGTGVSERDEPTRTHTMLLDRQSDRPPVAREKTELPVTDPEQPKPQAEVTAPPTASPPPQISNPKPAAKDAKTVIASDETANDSTGLTETAKIEKSAKLAKADATLTQNRETSPGSGWAVQLGSFSDKQNAERLATAVSKNGFAAYLMPSEQSGKTLYRVRVGPRDSRAQASELAERLAKAGYKGQVMQQRPES